MEETYVMNQVKEDSCFVSQDLMADMAKARKKYPENDIVQDYILPDFTNLRRGYTRTLDQPPVTDQVFYCFWLSKSNSKHTFISIIIYFV